MPAVIVERTSDEAVILVFWHDVGVVWLKNQGTVTNQTEAAQFVRKNLESWPRGVGLMVGLSNGLPPPPPDVRAALDGIYEELAPDIRALTYVLQGSGFQRATMRGVLMTMNLLVRRPYPTNVYSDLVDGTSWLFKKLAPDRERGTVDQFVATLSTILRGETPVTLRTKV